MRFQEREVENRQDNFLKKKNNVLGTVKEKTIRKWKELFKNSNKKKHQFVKKNHTNKTSTLLINCLYVFVLISFINILYIFQEREVENR